MMKHIVNGLVMVTSILLIPIFVILGAFAGMYKGMVMWGYSLTHCAPVVPDKPWLISWNELPKKEQDGE